MFYKDAHQIYRAAELDALPWLEHGFGTRTAAGWVRGPLITVRQVHSDRCLVADSTPGCLGEGDALLSATPGFYLGIRTADCVPILMADERLRVVAAVHAGWRGTAAGIAAQAVAALQQQFGTRPADLVAAIGPGVCGRCYEVGPEVAARFEPWFPERADLDRRTTVDLGETNRRQLLRAGLERVVGGAPCTACNSGDFHSYRRDREKAGRMISAVAIRP